MPPRTTYAARRTAGVDSDAMNEVNKLLSPS